LDLFTITRVVAGSTVDEYYIGGTNNQGNFAYVSWDFNDPVFRLERITQSRGVPAGSTSGSSSSQGSAVSTTVGMEVLCVAVGADVYVRPVITTTSQLLSIGRWSSSDGGYQELGLLAQSGTISLLTERVYCENNAILVPVTDQEDNTVAWYEVTLSGTENLNAEGYRYVSLKPISATQ
jgi:hypothetical protein